MSFIIIFFAVLYSSIKKWYPDQNLCNWLQTSLGKWMSWFLTFSINISVIIVNTVAICCGAQIVMCRWYCVQTCLFSCTSSNSGHKREEHFRDHSITFRMRMLKFSICAEASLGRIVCTFTKSQIYTWPTAGKQWALCLFFQLQIPPKKIIYLMHFKVIFYTTLQNTCNFWKEKSYLV